MEPGTEDPVVKLDKTANAMYVEDQNQFHYTFK